MEESVPRQNVLDELEKRVQSWDNPQGEMVAYRLARMIHIIGEIISLIKDELSFISPLP